MSAPLKTAIRNAKFLELLKACAEIESKLKYSSGGKPVNLPEAMARWAETPNDETGPEPGATSIETYETGTYLQAE